MKKMILLLTVIATNAFALDMNAAKTMGAQAVEKGKTVASACQKEQIEFCKAYKEMEALKECLKKNKEKLSPGCKASMGL